MVNYNILFPILLGIFVVLIICIKKWEILPLDRVAYLFLIGSVIFGGLSSLHLGITGKYLFNESLDDYRTWISLGGLVLLWLGYDVIRKELSVVKSVEKKEQENKDLE